MLNIQDKVILITGASSGIGEACARLLAEKGARLLLGARRTERLEQLVGEIRAAGGRAEGRIRGQTTIILISSTLLASFHGKGVSICRVERVCCCRESRCI